MDLNFNSRGKHMYKDIYIHSCIQHISTYLKTHFDAYIHAYIQK